MSSSAHLLSCGCNNWITYLKKLCISIKHARKVVRSLTEARVIPPALRVLPHGRARGQKRAPNSDFPFIRTNAELEMFSCKGEHRRNARVQMLMFHMCQRNDIRTRRVWRNAPSARFSFRWTEQSAIRDDTWNCHATKILCPELQVWCVCLCLKCLFKWHTGFSTWAAPRFSARMRNGLWALGRERILNLRCWLKYLN